MIFAKRTDNSKKGMALTVVIVVMLLLAIAAAGILILMTGHHRKTKHQADRVRAFYIAEAAAIHALWRIRNDEGGVGGSHPPAPNLSAMNPGETRTETYTMTSTPSVADWGGAGFVERIEIEYHKEGQSWRGDKSSDDHFRIRCKVRH